MKQIKKYRYRGINGTIISTVLLEDVSKTDLLQLTADDGKMLTDGNLVLKTALIPAENLFKWSEIADELEQ